MLLAEQELLSDSTRGRANTDQVLQAPPLEEELWTERGTDFPPMDKPKIGYPILSSQP